MIDLLVSMESVFGRFKNMKLCTAHLKKTCIPSRVYCAQLSNFLTLFLHLTKFM